MITVTTERDEKLDAHPRSNHTKPMYKPHYQLYKLNEIDQPIVVTTFLILGGTSFIYSAITYPLQ